MSRRPDNGVSITLLGFILDPDAPELGDAEIVSRMALDARQGISPVDPTERFSGRWLLIIEEPDDIRILADPAGLRQMFYNGSAESGAMCAASGLGILAELHGYEISTEARDFMASAGYAREEEHWCSWDILHLS